MVETLEPGCHIGDTQTEKETFYRNRTLRYVLYLNVHSQRVLSQTM